MASSAAAPAAAPDFGLPAAGDDAAWDALLRPLKGRLELIKPPRRCPSMLARTAAMSLWQVDVWVHCGLHYRRCPPAVPRGTAPVIGEMPPPAEADTRFRFFPLWRNDIEGGPAFSVRVLEAGASAALPGIDGGRVVELTRVAFPDRPLRFAAADAAGAREWARQLHMRAAPLATMWARRRGVPGGGAAVGPPAPRHATASRLPVLASIVDNARVALPNDALGGAAGIVTAGHEAHKLAVAAAPLLGLGLEALRFAVHLIAAARSVPDALGRISVEIDSLHDLLTSDVLPALQDLRDGQGDVAANLVNVLSSLVADVEAVAGELHHRVRSRRQRMWLTGTAVTRGVKVGSDFQDRLARSRERANELLRRINVRFSRKTAALVRTALEDGGQQQVAREAARKYPPPLPPTTFVEWNDRTLPAVQLYEAVMLPKSKQCAVVGTHGMGGVGKTTACKLVAHRVMAQEGGQERFRDGVHWVQLSKQVTRANVIEQLCTLAEALTAERAHVMDMYVIIERLRAVLATRACLIVVDDVWHDWCAAPFFDAFDGPGDSCLLISTRHEDVLDDSSVKVSIGTDNVKAAVGMLLASAELDGVVRPDKTKARVEHAVRTCGGHALALSLMGALVREHGWVAALTRVHEGSDEVLKVKLGRQSHYEYQSLWACLQASVTALGDDTESGALMRKRFRELCVVRSKEWLPWTALAALWGEDEKAVEKIALTLRSRSMVLVEDSGQGAAARLGLHDLVVEFLADPEWLGRAEKVLAHQQMIAGYCKRAGIRAAADPVVFGHQRVALRPVWTLPSDGYIELALPHVLSASDGDDELRVLLCDLRYIEWRVKLGRGSGILYRSDVEGWGGGDLDCVATVVERAVSELNVSFESSMQQLAFEVVERFGSASARGPAPAHAPALDYLCHSAMAALTKPSVMLYGASRLSVPGERRVIPATCSVRAIISVVGFDGSLWTITAHSDGNLRVWEDASGSFLFTLKGHTGSVSCLTPVPHGGKWSPARAVSGSLDQTLRIWDVDAKSSKLLIGHTSRITCVAVLGGEGGTPARVASGSVDKTVRLWDLTSCACLAVLTEHTQTVACLATALTDGSGSPAWVFSGSSDKTVRAWDVDGAPAPVPLKGHTLAVRCLAVVGGGRSGTQTRVVSGSYDKTVRVWDPKRASCLAVLDEHTHWVRCLAVLCDGSNGLPARVVSGSSDKTVRVWDLDSASCLAALTGHTRAVECLAVAGSDDSGSSAQVVSGSADQTVRVWDADGKTCVALHEGHTQPVKCVMMVGRGNSGRPERVLSGSDDGTLRLWDLQGTSCEAAAEGHTGAVTCFAVVSSPPPPDGCERRARVVSGSLDKTLRVWDLADASCMTVLPGHTGHVNCVAVVGGGGRRGPVTRVVSGSSDTTVILWDVDAASRLSTLRGHTGGVTHIAAVGDGAGGGPARVVSASSDNTLRVWNLDDPSCEAKLSGHDMPVTCMAVVDGGGGGPPACVVSASRDNTLRVWGLDGMSRADLQDEHTYTVQSMVGTGGAGGGASEERLLTGSVDQTMRVWDVARAAPVAASAAHTDAVSHVAVVGGRGRGGAALAVSVAADRTVRAWDLDGASEMQLLGAAPARVACVAAVHGSSDVWPRGMAWTPARQLNAAATGGAAAGERRPADEEGRVVVVVGYHGGCGLVDARGPTPALHFLPSPPHASVVCVPAPGRVVWGSSKGALFFGRVSL